MTYEKGLTFLFLFFIFFFFFFFFFFRSFVQCVGDRLFGTGGAALIKKHSCEGIP